MDDLAAEDEIRELRARVQRLEEENAQLKAANPYPWESFCLPQMDQSSQQRHVCTLCGMSRQPDEPHVCIKVWRPAGGLPEFVSSQETQQQGSVCPRCGEWRLDAQPHDCPALEKQVAWLHEYITTRMI